ncbi:anti-sigma factor family protein [Brevibacillus porteri]|uniref:anti-sigma factor family protein n=1 Tax=Brevibacillus porteri TaxID=2126350 RepID=UPI003D23A703
MKCLTFEKIMAYLDDELTVWERSEIDKHLAEYSHCLVEFEAYAGDCEGLHQLLRRFICLIGIRASSWR